MDTNKLSASDQKFLNRLNIPQSQKVLLENYWLENPATAKKWSAWNVFSYLYGPVLIAIMASPYFVKNTIPLVNISLVTLWLICPLVALTYFVIALSMRSPAENKEDKLMDRSFAMLLPGAISSFNKTYAIIVWGLMAGLTASHGYFVTSVMVLMCWMAKWLFFKISQVTLEKFLEERVNETPAQRITRMAMASLNK